MSAMEPLRSHNSNVFRVGPEDYRRESWYSFGSFLVLVFLWILLSFLLDKFVPFFRWGSHPVGSSDWFGRSFITGACWAALMVMWSGFARRRRRRRYELEIKADRIVESSNQETHNIYRGELQGVREWREFGKLHGVVVASKNHNI